MKKTYLSEFINLKCANDILNIVSPLHNPDKEITEAMAMIKQIRKIALSYPMKYTLYDFCAGNALTSVISAFLLPIRKNIAIDKKKRDGRWDLVRRFEYWFIDIRDFDPILIENDSIIVAIHACGELSEIIIDIFKKSNAEYLFLMPCCIGKITMKFPDIIAEKLSRYEIWAWQLYEKCRQIDCDVNLLRDKKCLSPCNIILKARKLS